MEPDECDFIELRKGMCRYFIGNTNNPRDIECCHNHCSLHEDKKLMKEGIQSLIRKHNRLTQKR